MATILTSQIIVNSKGAVDDYSTKAVNKFDELQGVIDGIKGVSFRGEGFNGYEDYFKQKITPALTENLTGPNSVMEGLKKILDDVNNQLLEITDPNIGEYNRNPSAGA